jgi:cytochrome c oxidase accessory protein FixG
MKSVTDHRDTLYTIDKRGNRKWVYVHHLVGKFIRLRTAVCLSLVVFYLSLPWITINGRQAVLLDIQHRRFVFFGLELWATDTIFLFLVLATLGISLFLFTSILGRVWCGWACPETVFLEFVFRPIERFIEGTDSERRKLDASPWTLNKVIRKGLKHAICAAIAWVLASTALAYFIGREPLLNMMMGSPLNHLYEFSLTLVLMGVMAFQFGWFREQFCTLLCPYARFQSVLMDQNSLLVGYDFKRGEPRGKLRDKNQNNGDCVDCGLCVRVCPTGIDIRNGTQLECIACANCVDACNSVMVKIGKPQGLIRYTTENNLQGKKTFFVRPRIFVYAIVLVVVISSFAYKLSTRQALDVEIVRVAEKATYSIDSNNIVTNQFSLKLSNKSNIPQKFVINLISPSNIEIISPLPQLVLKPRESQAVPVFVRAPRSGFIHGVEHVIVDIVANSEILVRREFNLIGPE